MEITLITIFMLLGISFFILEIFFLPGVSLGVIGGVLFCGAAVWYAFYSLGAAAGWLTVLGGIIIFVIALWLFLKFKIIEKVSLKKELEGNVNQLEGIDIKEGAQGKAITRMAPIGKITIDGHEVEAKSEDGFIDQGTDIVVTHVDAFQITVRKM